MQITLSNSWQLTVTPADFLKADRLRIAIINALAKTDLGIGGNFDVSRVLETDFNFEKIIKSALFLTADEKIMDSFWECCVGKAVIGKELKAVGVDFFEDENNRELFPEIFIAVLEANVKPFFTGLWKMLKSKFHLIKPILEK